MIRLYVGLCGALVLLVGSRVVDAAPVEGIKGFQQRVDGGTTKVLKVTFKGGERACVIVVGDHKPVVPLQLKVEDATGKLIGEEKGGRDLCAVIWYPPRDGEYTIHISVPHIPADEDYNLLTIALK